MNDAQETGNGGCIVTALIIIGLFIASFNGCRGCKEEKTAPPPKKETISQGEAVALGISALLIGIAAESNNSSRKQKTRLPSEYGSKKALEETLRSIKSQRIRSEHPNAIHHYDSDGNIWGYSE